MKKLLSLLSITLFLSFIFGCKKAGNVSDARSKEVVIYTYGSFVSEWGPGSKIAEGFKASTGLTVTFVDCGDGVQILSRAILEKKDVQADILLGLDNNTAQKAIDANILDFYEPKSADKIIASSLQAELGKKGFLTPYDYSHFALIFDTRSTIPEPKSLSDLTNPIYKNKIILMDPRTSTPGLGFVAWTKAIFTDEAEFDSFWKALKPNVLTMAPSWSAGYGLFTNGEAPLVISYTTSPAANLEYDGIDYYKALIFDEGHYMQVEGAGILKNAKNKKGAELFMDYLISKEAQETLPLTQWMYPVNNDVTIPECYQKAAGITSKTVTTDANALSSAAEKAVAALR